jgi:hypothetical protein
MIEIKTLLMGANSISNLANGIGIKKSKKIN